MNLIIDVGNTLVKVAVYSNQRLLNKETVAHNDIVDIVQLLLQKYPSVSKGIISSVGRLNKKKIKKLKSCLQLIELSHKTRLPFKNYYNTPKTLGVDRLALVSASVLKYPEENVLIIDAGTCITYDFITHKNHYLGGAISPGINMRYRSLNNLTANLPLLKRTAPKSIIGKSTNASIHSGVIIGVSNEIDGVINEYKSRFQHLTVILTGGDAKFLSKRLKNGIFANSNFLMDGLNHILEFNLD